MARKRSTERGRTDNREPDRGPAQPRPFWSGVLAFGLVSLPVSLFSANRGKPFSLRMVDQTGNPLSRRYFCEKEGRVLARDEIVRGYPVDRERFVIIEDEELQALAPEKSREIDLRRFVPLAQINPVFFDRGYFLVPDSGATKAYRLLAQSMQDKERAGLATFVMREREYLIILIAERGILRAETLRFDDEIRTPQSVGLPELTKPDNTQVRAMERAITALSDESFDRSLLADRELQRLEQMIEARLKRGSGVLKAPAQAAEEEESNVVDLMQVLKERLQGKGPVHKDAGESSARDEDLTELSREALYERARDKQLPGRSKMSKQELVEALKQTG